MPYLQFSRENLGKSEQKVNGFDYFGDKYGEKWYMKSYKYEKKKLPNSVRTSLYKVNNMHTLEFHNVYEYLY